jgi:hypothetical protein
MAHPYAAISLNQTAMATQQTAAEYQNANRSGRPGQAPGVLTANDA